MTYKHLDRDERYQIYALLCEGKSNNEIARALGRDRTTIRDEIKRGAGAKGYRPAQAQAKACARAKNSRNAKTIGAALWQEVRKALIDKLSPEQIAGTHPISHESVYKYVYADKQRGGDLHTHLRCQKVNRKRYASGQQRRGQLINRRGIEHRPASVERRNRYGHWEADTIVGAGQRQALVSVAERKSGLLKLRKVPNRKAGVVCAAMIEMLSPYRGHRLFSVTCDNGREFAMHQTLDRALGCTTYFADPYCSWQRGTNENTNGLVRQYIPKHRPLSEVSDAEVQAIEDQINRRPRKRLNFDSPINRMPRKPLPRGTS